MTRVLGKLIKSVLLVVVVLLVGQIPVGKKTLGQHTLDRMAGLWKSGTALLWEAKLPVQLPKVDKVPGWLKKRSRQLDGRLFSSNQATPSDTDEFSKADQEMLMKVLQE